MDPTTAWTLSCQCAETRETVDHSRTEYLIAVTASDLRRPIRGSKYIVCRASVSTVLEVRDWLLKRVEESLQYKKTLVQPQPFEARFKSTMSLTNRL